MRKSSLGGPPARKTARSGLIPHSLSLFREDQRIPATPLPLAPSVILRGTPWNMASFEPSRREPSHRTFQMVSGCCRPGGTLGINSRCPTGRLDTRLPSPRASGRFLPALPLGVQLGQGVHEGGPDGVGSCAPLGLDDDLPGWRAEG